MEMNVYIVLCFIQVWRWWIRKREKIKPGVGTLNIPVEKLQGDNQTLGDAQCFQTPQNLAKNTKCNFNTNISTFPFKYKRNYSITLNRTYLLTSWWRMTLMFMIHYRCFRPLRCVLKRLWFQVIPCRHDKSADLWLQQVGSFFYVLSYISGGEMLCKDQMW